MAKSSNNYFQQIFSPDADSKATLFQARYLMLQQKIQRLKIFQDKTSRTTQNFTENSEEQNEIKYSLKTVDFLLGTNAKLENIIILGMLTTLKHGRYSIEDPTGSLDLDLTETKFSRGLYTENNFVLAQGWYEDRLFHVAALGMHFSHFKSCRLKNIVKVGNT